MVRALLDWRKSMPGSLRRAIWKAGMSAIYRRATRGAVIITILVMHNEQRVDA